MTIQIQLAENKSPSPTRVFSNVRGCDFSTVMFTQFLVFPHGCSLTLEVVTPGMPPKRSIGIFPHGCSLTSEVVTLQNSNQGLEIEEPHTVAFVLTAVVGG